MEQVIDEKKLIEEINECDFTADVNKMKANDNGPQLKGFYIGYTEMLVKLQPKIDWIPCENETPKTNGVYQTVRKVIEGDTVYYIEGASYFDGQNTWHNDIGVNHGREYPNVVAWQPIQPYKKEGAE